jgi:hypothetical protein
MVFVHGTLGLIFQGLAILAFAIEVWALVDASRRRSDAFLAAGKQNKRLWLIILSFATLFGFAAAVEFIYPLSIFTIVAFIAAGIYLADVRPALRGLESGGSSSSGPYGPW